MARQASARPEAMQGKIVLVEHEAAREAAVEIGIDYDELMLGAEQDGERDERNT